MDDRTIRFWEAVKETTFWLMVLIVMFQWWDSDDWQKRYNRCMTDLNYFTGRVP